MATRVVLDTHVLVSGLLMEQGHPRRLIDAWLEGRFTLVSSLYQVEELDHVFSYPRIVRRICIQDTDLDLLLAARLSEAELVPGRLELSGVTRDPKDDQLVACAREGNAEYLVSGDRDLLDLGEYDGIRMVTPHRLAEILGLSVPLGKVSGHPGLVED